MRSRRFLGLPRARVIALVVCATALGSLATASVSAASPPVAGANCQPDGKISGRGSSLQLWFGQNMNQQFSNDVCGTGTADPLTTASPAGTLQTTNTFDPTHPSDPSISGATSAGNWQVAYDDQNSQLAGYTGSGRGRDSISCRTDAFGASDIPNATADFQNTSGAYVGKEADSNGKSCNNSGGTNLKQPFEFAVNTNSNGSGTFTGPGTPATGSLADSVTNPLMVLPVGGSPVEFPVNLQSTTGCTYTAPLTLKFTIADLWAIFAGYVPNWSYLDTNHTITLAGGGSLVLNDSGENMQLASCTTPLVRVVRFDTSGTTQAVLNFLNGAINTNQNVTTQQNCSATGVRGDKTSASLTTSTWKTMDTNIATAGQNEAWPGESGTSGQGQGTGGALLPPCASFVDYAGSSGGNSLLGVMDNHSTTQAGCSTAPAVNGSIGYADESDAAHDPGAPVCLTIPTIEGSTSPSLPGLGYVATGPTATTYQSASANPCTFSGVTLPPGGNADFAGMNNDYAIDQNTDSNGINKFDDASWTAQKGVYPACTLTYDFVWSGQHNEYGNLKVGSPPNTAGSYAAAGPEVSYFVGDGSGTSQNLTNGGSLTMGDGAVQFPDGIPYSGSVQITTDNNGVETVQYSSLTDDITTQTFTLNGISGVTGTSVTVGDGNNATFGTPTVSSDVNPDVGLNPDQEQTLYSYFTYMYSDAAQGSFANADYIQLPEASIGKLRAAFQAEF